MSSNTITTRISLRNEDADDGDQVCIVVSYLDATDELVAIFFANWRALPARSYTRRPSGRRNRSKISPEWWLVRNNAMLKRQKTRATSNVSDKFCASDDGSAVVALAAETRCHWHSSIHAAFQVTLSEKYRKPTRHMATVSKLTTVRANTLIQETE
ncbi:hypothetical protein [Rhizobium sp. WL3]|uniref:hypothetical protein n=1 Tax=Rhizobium sp. WL3 TaxID=2603277 RepID=UPI001FF0453C|nr:hypothetical protein [Rhizobium sp. WL3]